MAARPIHKVLHALGVATLCLRLVLLGASGVGKGTQAQLLNQRLGACHLSTGEVFRAAGSLKACQQTPAMAAALDYMRRGDLVSDSTISEMVRERSDCLHCQGGFVLDGFPRTAGAGRGPQQVGGKGESHAK